MKLKYSVVFERMPSNYGAYVPDLPGCISTGDTWQEIHEMIREAIAFHIEGLTEDGEPLPAPQLSISEAMASDGAVLFRGFDLDETSFEDMLGRTFDTARYLWMLPMAPDRSGVTTVTSAMI